MQGEARAKGEACRLANAFEEVSVKGGGNSEEADLAPDKEDGDVGVASLLLLLQSLEAKLENQTGTDLLKPHIANISPNM